MIQIDNVGNEPGQLFTIEFEEADAEFQLRYYDQLAFWDFDIEYMGIKKRGVKIISNSLLLHDYRLPFDLMVIDNSNERLDAYAIDDFSKGRLSLYVLREEHIELFRSLLAKG